MGELDVDRARAVFAGEHPFDESLMVDDEPAEETPPTEQEQLVRT